LDILKVGRGRVWWQWTAREIFHWEDTFVLNSLEEARKGDWHGRRLESEIQKNVCCRDVVNNFKDSLSSQLGSWGWQVYIASVQAVENLIFERA
jgi:hypothetical protein